MVINITNCSGIDDATETVSTVGNASEITGVVTSDDEITFQWGVHPVIRVTYGHVGLAALFSSGFGTLALLALLALVIVAVAIIVVVKKIGGGF